MERPSTRTITALYVLALSLLLVILLHLFGADIFDGAWMARHWSSVSSAYLIGWALVAAALVLLCLRYPGFLDRLASTPPAIISAAVLVLLLTILLGYNHFVYGTGNLRVAQIAQADPIVHRWYEYGASLLVSLLYKIVAVSDLKDTTAGALAWRIYAYTATALSIWASIRLAGALTDNGFKRVFVFATLFAGPHLLSMLGLIAVEPGLVAVFLWQAVLLYQLSQNHSTTRLALLWVVTLLGVWLHWTGIVLIPPALLLSLSPGERLRLPAVIIALLAFVAIITAVYLRVGSDFEFSQFVLMLEGHNPRADYALFSGRHITDLLQLLAITFPAVLLLKLFWWRQLPTRRSRFRWAITAQAIGALAVLIMLNPENGMPLDLPLLLVYLTPMAVLLATFISDLDFTTGPARAVIVVGGLSNLIMIGSVLPVYADIHNADQYLKPYLQRHNALFMSGAFAFRDAYFERGELDQANAWEWEVPLQSLAYMHLEGASRLVDNQEYSEGLKSLYQIKVEHPYWAEPRALIATTLMSLGRPQQARPEIDTCLMLQPYRQEFHINRYTALRQQRKHDSALMYIQRALELWPDETSIRVDHMYG
ncbi:hypothetical protein GF356_12705, partial [candidate division GN15 bacterium]|nr:hypothetical protein [candidate division GN15 bacterium]